MASAREIIWRKSAIIYLEKAIDYIREDSAQNADVIANAILATVEKSTRFPEHFPTDKYKLDNTGAFRAFEIYGFRISFYYNPNVIRIVRIRHTKQKPLSY